MNPINKYFKYIYVIYMPKREEYIKKFLNNLNIKVKFIPAVNRDNLPSLSKLLEQGIINKYFLYKHLEWEGYPVKSIKDFEKDKNPKIITKLNGLKGTIGLQLSYLKIFEEFLNDITKEDIKNGFDKCLIFEDDIILPNNLKKEELFNRFESIFKEELNNVNWDIINFGRCQDYCDINKNFSKNLVKNTTPFCTHAVAYSSKVAEETLINSKPISQSGDWLMAWYYYNNPKFKCFSVKGRLFDQNEDLGTLLGHVDKLPECKGQKIFKKYLKNI